MKEESVPRFISFLCSLLSTHTRINFESIYKRIPFIRCDHEEALAADYSIAAVVDFGQHLATTLQTYANAFNNTSA